MNDLNVNDLDLGIRDIVALLRAHGFETTDSGDGVSKPREWFDSGEALPYPHVFILTRSQDMVAESHRLADVLGPKWCVEASYSARDKTAILIATTELTPDIARTSEP